MGDDESRPSDLPTDLSQEREIFVRSFLKRGFELTEDLVKENSTLRRELQTARDTNARLRAQVASDDAIRDLLTKIEDLETEKTTLLRKSNELKKDRTSDQSRFQELEAELGDLANLYIAVYQLHQNYSVRRVVRHVLDILGQLVGAYGIVVYVLDERGTLALPIAQENIEGEPGPVPVGNGPVGEACMTGLIYAPDLKPAEEREGSLLVPLAVIPLVAEGRPIGAVSIVSMLEQKTHWAAVDRELLRLVSERAGNALLSAHLYGQEVARLKADASAEEEPTSPLRNPIHPAVRALAGLPEALGRNSSRAPVKRGTTATAVSPHTKPSGGLPSSEGE